MTTLEVLRKLEWWKEPDWCYARCLECGGLQQYGHAEGCELQAAIDRELVAAKALKEERDARLAAEAALRRPRPTLACATCGGPFAGNDLPVMKPQDPEPVYPAREPPLLEGREGTWWLVHEHCPAPKKS